MTGYQIYWTIISIGAFTTFFFYNPLFINEAYTIKFIFKKSFLLIVLNIFLSYAQWSSENDTLNALSLTSIFIYGFYILAKENPCGYAKSILDLLKFIFIILSFFTTIDFRKGYITESIITILFMLLISIISYLIYRKNFEDSKSEHLEIVVLCIEHMVALGFVSFVDSNAINRVIMMVLIEQLIFSHLHIAIMYCVGVFCKEDVSGFIMSKKYELLR